MYNSERRVSYNLANLCFSCTEFKIIILNTIKTQKWETQKSVKAHQTCEYYFNYTY